MCYILHLEKMVFQENYTLNGEGRSQKASEAVFVNSARQQAQTALKAKLYALNQYRQCRGYLLRAQ